MTKHCNILNRQKENKELVQVEIEQLIKNQQYKPNDTGHWVYTNMLIKYIMI